MKTERRFRKTEKMFAVFLLLLCTLGLNSCDDDRHPQAPFNLLDLPQTQWTGSFTEAQNGQTRQADFGVVFYTENKGKYSLKWNGETEVEEGGFNYSVDGNILSVNDWVYIQGDWLLVQSESGNTMTLEKGTGMEGAYRGVLILKKK